MTVNWSGLLFKRGDSLARCLFDVLEFNSIARALGILDLPFASMGKGIGLAASKLHRHDPDRAGGRWD